MRSTILSVCLLLTFASWKGYAQKRALRFSGSLSLQTPITFAYTRPYRIGGNAKKSTSLIPSLSLFLTTSDLPGGWLFNTRLQLQYRYSSTFNFQRPTVLRIYQGMLTKHLRYGEVRIGRFYSTYERFSSFWDGLAFRYGNPDRYIGIAAGFLPDQWVEKFTTDRPRFSVFAQYEHRVGKLRAGLNLSYHEVRPQRIYPLHRYSGTSLWLRSPAFQLSSNFQLDRDPESGLWKSSYWYNRATLLFSYFRLTGRYAYRRFYSIWRTQHVFSPRRDQYELRLDLSPSSFSAGASIMWNYYTSELQSKSYYGFFGMSRLPLLPISWRASGSYWEARDGYSLLTSISLQPPLPVEVGAMFYRTDFMQVVTNSFALTLRGRFQLPRQIRLTTNLRLQFGDYLNQFTLYTGLWIPL